MKRVFVDTGSSVNIIFNQVFDQLQLDGEELCPINTPYKDSPGIRYNQWVRFISLSLGEETLRRTRRTPFLAVNTKSTYNFILGRSMLSAFQAVVLTFYQNIKFPIENQKVKESQVVAKRCYICRYNLGWILVSSQNSRYLLLSYQGGTINSSWRGPWRSTNLYWPTRSHLSRHRFWIKTQRKDDCMSLT